MQDDLFEVDLDFLASGESSMPVEKKPTEEQKKTAPVESTDSGKTPSNELEEDEDGVDLEELAGGIQEQKTAVDNLSDELKDFKTVGKEDLDKNTKGTPESKEPSSSPFISLLAKSLSEEGILAGMADEDLEKIKDAKSLTEAIGKQIKDNEFADLDENQKAFLTAVRAGIPAEYAAQRVNNSIAYNNIKEADVQQSPELRTLILKNNFLAKGFTEAQAEKQIKRSVDLGEDTADAIEALEILKTEELAQLAKDAKAAEDKKKADKEKSDADLADFKTKVLNTEEILGLKVPSSVREDIFKILTTNVSKTTTPMNAIQAARAANPKEFDLKLAYFFSMTKGFTDVTDFKNPVTSKAVKELDEKLKATEVSGGSSNAHSSSAKGLYEALKSADPRKL
jgi:hypothetical protein